MDPPQSLALNKDVIREAAHIAREEQLLYAPSAKFAKSQIPQSAASAMATQDAVASV